MFRTPRNIAWPFVGCSECYSSTSDSRRLCGVTFHIVKGSQMRIHESRWHGYSESWKSRDPAVARLSPAYPCHVICRINFLRRRLAIKGRNPGIPSMFLFNWPDHSLCARRTATRICTSDAGCWSTEIRIIHDNMWQWKRYYGANI